MKNSLSLKLSKLPTILLVFLVSILSYSCGKDNKIIKNGSGVAIPQPAPGDPLSPYVGTNPLSNELQYIQTIKARSACQRIPDITYTVSGNSGTISGSRSTISGQLVQGASPGIASKVFAGISSWGDIVTVIRKVNGTVVTGYDLIFSFCSNASEGLFVLNRPIAVRGINQLVTDDQSNCAIGNVDAGIFVIELGQYQAGGTMTFSAVTLSNPGLRFTKVCQ